MISGLVLVAGSALLGGALALAARRRPLLLELTRTFAFAAALGVVGFHLLPEILPRLGPEALLWIAAGFALPWLLEALARMLGPSVLARRGIHGLRVAAEVAFIALVFHSVVEGLALLAVVHSSDHATDVQLAILAHHAPLTAAVALPFLELRGARSAAVRVALVGLSGAIGVVLGQAVPGLASGTDIGVVQRATAVTAGALLHVVSDEIREQRFGTRWERLCDMLAGALGFALAGLGAFLDLRNAQGVLAFGRSALSLAISAGPALVLGLAVRWGTVRYAPRTAESLRGSAAGVFPIAALLGLAAAAVRVVLGAAFWLFGRRLAGAQASPPARTLVEEYALRAPPVFALFLLAAAAEALAPAGFFASQLPVLVALSLAVFAQASASGAALIAAAVVHRGLPANLAVPFLALGSLPLGRGNLARMAAVAAVGIGFALAAAAALSGTDVPDRVQRAADACFAGSRNPAPAQIASAPLGAACLALIVVLGIAMVYRKGARGFFLSLRHPDLRIVLPGAPAGAAASEATH